MNKTNDRFCPDCAHHVYATPERAKPYFCQICGQDLDADEVISLAQAQPVRDGWSE